MKGAGLRVGRRIPELALVVTTVPGAGSVNGKLLDRHGSEKIISDQRYWPRNNKDDGISREGG